MTRVFGKNRCLRRRFSMLSATQWFERFAPFLPAFKKKVSIFLLFSLNHLMRGHSNNLTLLFVSGIAASMLDYTAWRLRTTTFTSFFVLLFIENFSNPSNLCKTLLLHIMHISLLLWRCSASSAKSLPSSHADRYSDASSFQRASWVAPYEASILWLSHPTTILFMSLRLLLLCLGHIALSLLLSSLLRRLVRFATTRRVTSSKNIHKHDK